MKFILLALLAWLTACVQPPEGGAESSRSRSASEQAAEKALFAGIHAYEDANYVLAETQLLRALSFGLPSGKDISTGHKHLAFIYCTSNRLRQCEAAFRSALKANPSFSLSKSEMGHPLWGSVFERVAKP
jgi:Tfp pilus assembly protein PilF